MTDVKLKNERSLYRNPYMRIVERVYAHEGQSLRYFVKEEPDFSVCGAVTTAGEILMVRQFRPGPGLFTYDFPGGMIDEGDTAEEAVAKELLEETGYQGEIEAITTTFVTAYSTARKHIFLARNCIRVAAPTPEPNTVAELIHVSQADFVNLLRSGQLVDLDCGLLLARSLGLAY